MIPITSYAGKLVAVFGLGLSGVATAKALEAGGAFVACWDDGEERRKVTISEQLTCVDLSKAKWDEFDALVLAPGVPLTHPEPHWTVKKAQEAGVEIIGDIELFLREHKALGSKAKIVGITGTNGKSTTTALTHHLLKSAGRTVQMGGNIGKAVLELNPFRDDNIYVIEFSSYQIDLTPGLQLDAAALLNITPDHIDRHGTIENYAAVKERIFQNMDAGQTAVIGIDDGYCQAISSRLNGDFDTKYISIEKELENGYFAKDGLLFEAVNGEQKLLTSFDGISTLRGSHNWQNAAIAYGLVQSLGLSLEDVQEGFETFPGLEHRMQEVGRDGSVLYINDSKATNADAAAKALAAFDKIYWIAGGVAKDGGIESLRSYFPKIAKAYLIGEAAEDFAEVLGEDVPHEICGTVDKAVKQAQNDVFEDGGDEEKVVLFSPACASFDQYANFVLRGKAFCDAVVGGEIIPPS